MSVTLDHPAQSLVGTHLDLRGESSRLARNRAALRDVADGFTLWRLAVMLGWLDIKLRYRGSVLGPFWLTLSTAVMVGALGVVYGTLFAMDLAHFLPFLAVSLVMWNAISSLIGEACAAFTQAEGTIRSVRMPFFVQAIRVVVRNALVLAHNIIVFIVVFAVYGVIPGTEALMVLPGLAIWLIDAFACCLLLGALCARFRDIPPIVGSIVQIAFYITPVVWKPEQLGPSGWWLPLNPFDSLLDIVRGPLLSQPTSALGWTSALGFSIALWVTAWLVFAKVRARLAFWV